MSWCQIVDIRCIGPLMLLNECFPLAFRPILQLKVPRMSNWPVALTLQQYEYECPNDRDKI